MSEWTAAAAAGNAATLGVFGDAVTYTPAGGEASTVSVVWSEGKDSRAAEVWCVAADLPSGYAKGDTITRGGVAYRVACFVNPAGEDSDVPCVDDAGAVRMRVRLSR